jgi:AraC family transcriptional regulator
MANRWPMRWRYICSIVTPCGATHRLSTKEVSGYRLKRVLEHIADNVADDLSLSQLAAVAGMSPHYFAELFRQSTGRAPHRYVLLQRIERVKQSLRNPRRNTIEAGLDAGFQYPSHLAHVFRKFVGTSPSRFQSEMQLSRRFNSVISSA